MTTSGLPDMHHFVAFNVDPNDPVTTPAPVYVDMGSGLTAGYPQVLGWSDMSRGRQYELARTMGADPQINFRDVSEYLNPANTASPLYPFVQPYRASTHLAVWPKGQTGNLLNTANWRVSTDPTFESYTAGTTPDFITAYSTAGSVAPTVTTSNPFQGTKSLTYDVPTDAANRYGVQYSIECVPGQQYCASAYVRQTSASTQIIRVSDQTLTSEPFNRTTASGWGSATAPLAAGGAWTNVGGSAADRSTTAATPYAAGYASLSLGTVNVSRAQLQPTSVRDVRQRVRFAIGALATGGPIRHRALARYVDASNHYYVELTFNADRTVSIALYKRVAGVLSQIGTTPTALPGVVYSIGDVYNLDFRITQNLLTAAAWREGAPALDVDANPQVVAADTSITASAQYGLMYELDNSFTGTLPYVFVTSSYSAVGAVEGSTTAATGSYQRLQVTWTATLPRHTLSVLNTAGSATAGTVNLDALMVNTGSSPSAFTSTGSSVYPVMSPYVERWTRTWESAGNEGYCDVPCVDALAALNAINVPPPVDGQIALTGPDWWWRLDGGAGTVQFPDISGNNGPSLGLNISKYGVGELPAGGATMDIPGGGGVTGVTFTPPTPATGSTLAGTSLGIGKLSEDVAQSFTLPRAITSTWAVTVAMWVRATASGASQTAFYASKQLSSTAGQAFVPIYMDINGTNGTAFTNIDSAGAIHLLNSGGGLSGINILDGEPHLLIGIVTQDSAGDTVVYRYIDDALDGVDVATTASLGGLLRGQSDSLSIGATDDGANFLAMVNGSISQVAVWSRELSGSETALLWSAGQGWVAQTSMARLAQDLEYAQYTGPTRISEIGWAGPGSPVTTMQAPTWVAPYTAQADLLAITEAEQGCSWVAADGAVVFEGRLDRFLRLTPTWTFGENTAGGEAPYLDDVAFDYDPQFVYANVSVSRPGGTTARGGLGPDVAQAARRYFPRAFGLTIDVETDEQAQDTADFIFYSHRAPLQRVSVVRLNPAANTTLWPLVLNIEVGQLVQLTRRVKAANGGTGLTTTGLFFVENVGHSNVRYELASWDVELLLSPVGTGPGPTMQPWILENATYSVLGSTTVLGF